MGTECLLFLLAILSLIIGIWLGYRCRMRNHLVLWAVVDLVWILFSLISIFLMLFNLSQIQRDSERAAAIAHLSSLNDSIRLNVFLLRKENCETPIYSEKLVSTHIRKAQLFCKKLDEIVFYSSNKNFSGQLAKQIADKLMKFKDTATLQVKLQEYEKFYSHKEDILKEDPYDKTIKAYMNISRWLWIFSIIFPFRLGKSFADFFRFKEEGKDVK